MIREMFSFNNHAENEAGKLVPDCFFFKKKSFIFGKAIVQQLDITILACNISSLILPN